MREHSIMFLHPEVMIAINANKTETNYSNCVLTSNSNVEL